MIPFRQPSPGKVPLWAALPVLTGLLLAGCGHDISGVVSAPQSGTKFAPQAKVEVLLVKGDLPAAIDELLAREGSVFGKDTEQAALVDLQEQRKKLEAELAQSLETLHTSLPVDPPLTENTCQNRTSAAVEQAQQAFAAVRDSLRGTLQQLGIESDDATDIVAGLEKRLGAKLDEEAQALSARYPQESVVVDSKLTLGVSSKASDQLCWTITNKGPIAITHADLYFTYEGKRVSDSLARAIWVLPEGTTGQALSVRNDRGEEVLGIVNGTKFERCSATANARLSREQMAEAEGLGLGDGAATRSGKWEVEIENVRLASGIPEKRTVQAVKSTAVRWEHVPQAPSTLFAEQLREFRERQPEAVALAKLTASDATGAARRARSADEACKRLRPLQEQIARIDKLIAGIKAGKAGDPEIKTHLMEFLEQRKRTGNFVNLLTNKAERLREQGIVDVKRTEGGGKFAFDDVEPGTYTVVSTHANREGEPFTAMLTLNVGYVFGATADLRADQFKPGTLAEIVETRITGKPPAPRPTARPTPTPGKQPPPNKPVAKPKGGH